MSDSTIGIIILFLVSIVVRIIPSFVSLPLSDENQRNIKSILPVAVFLNLIAYCIISEVNSTNSLTAAISFLFLFILLMIGGRVGVFSAVLLSSGLYFFLKYLI